MERNHTRILLWSKNNFSVFYEHHRPLVSEFSIGFYLVSILPRDLNLTLVCWTRFFPFLSSYCHWRSRNPVSWIEKVVNSLGWVYPSCLRAQHGRVLSLFFSASRVTNLGKPLGCLIIAKSYVGDYSYELSQACASAPTRAVYTRNSALSLLVHPGTDHRLLSSCLVYVVHVKEFLRFFSWQLLENNVWNQKQICYFCAETSVFFKLASK